MKRWWSGIFLSFRELLFEAAVTDEKERFSNVDYSICLRSEGEDEWD